MFAGFEDERTATNRSDWKSEKSKPRLQRPEPNPQSQWGSPSQVLVISHCKRALTAYYPITNCLRQWWGVLFTFLACSLHFNLYFASAVGGAEFSRNW